MNRVSNLGHLVITFVSFGCVASGVKVEYGAAGSPRRIDSAPRLLLPLRGTSRRGSNSSVLGGAGALPYRSSVSFAHGKAVASSPRY